MEVLSKIGNIWDANHIFRSKYYILIIVIFKTQKRTVLFSSYVRWYTKGDLKIYFTSNNLLWSFYCFIFLQQILCMYILCSTLFRKQCKDAFRNRFNLEKQNNLKHVNIIEALWKELNCFKNTSPSPLAESGTRQSMMKRWLSSDYTLPCRECLIKCLTLDLS